MRPPVARTRPSPARRRSRPPPPRRFRPYPARNQQPRQPEQPRTSRPSHPRRAQANCRTTIFEGVSARRLRGRRRIKGWAAGKHLCLNLYRKSSWVRSPLQSYKSLSTDYSRRGTGRRISSSADMNHSHHNKCPCYPGRCHGSGTAAHETPPRSIALDRTCPPDEDRKARPSSFQISLDGFGLGTLHGAPLPHSVAVWSRLFRNSLRIGWT